MENKLRNLYALQKIDSSLDELEDMKGDLPAEIAELEGKFNQLTSQVQDLEKTMRNSFVLRDGADSEIVTLREKVEKYKSQQFQVRNNKEYDSLTKEMDYATETIAKLEKEMEVLEGKATLARQDIEKTNVLVEEMNKILEEKRAALAEVSKATEEEELKFRHQRQKVLARIAKPDLTAYERIRKAKKGVAVVPVKRGACGGCYNKVPPQKLLELRQNSKIYTCEHCGRIIISKEIEEAVTEAS